jgi:hypothetical protein
MTSLLSDTIGGEALTLMYVCISPSYFDREATLDTMRFAAETGKIKNRPGALTDSKYEFCISKLFSGARRRPITGVVQVPKDVHTMSDSQKAEITVTEIRVQNKTEIYRLYLELSNGEKGGHGSEYNLDSYTLPKKRLVNIDIIY